MMERLAVHEISDDPDQLIVVLQYPNVDTGPAVLVAPLMADSALKPIPSITLEVELRGKSYLLAMHQLSAFPKQFIGAQIGSLLEHEYAIQRALARLFFGN
ncbi:MAG: CcdB family protein [Henriciella sp.]